ncbi:hypothetical protein NXX53_06405 [Bacteroides salyersiae]|uniref:hypothetical protein n=1 Tax=Bacteroides sp. TaxID=29523 RepID=UPI0025BAD417|nr:hypothetical protein [Bacteroides sp.]MCS2956907.1 hypothetical protein [Bacteroides salyersiae]
MIRDKKPNKEEPIVADTKLAISEIIPPEQEFKNPFVEMYNAVKRAILTIKENPLDSHSEPFFKTIMIDTGQFGRIIREENMETEIAFPAIFIHFVNVRYLVQQQRIGEGRATMRVRFILNNLNNSDPERECDPFIVFQQLNTAIQDAKTKEPALNERCNLTYFDMPITVNMLQAYWIDYEVWFREQSAWKYRDWVKRYLVMPPFTNHDDAPEHDNEDHGNHKKPTYRESSSFVPSVEEENKEEESVDYPDEEEP